MAKPIFILSLPINAEQHALFQQKLDAKLTDYHVLVFYKEGDPKGQVFNPDELTPLQYDDLKKAIITSLEETTC